MTEANRVRQYDNDILAAIAGRTIKRLWILIIMILLGWVCTTAYFLTNWTALRQVPTTEWVQQAEFTPMPSAGGDAYAFRF